MEASVRTRQIGSATYRIALTGESDMYTAAAAPETIVETEEVLDLWQPGP